MNPRQEEIGEILSALKERSEKKLLALTEAELADLWWWNWEEDRSVEWNTYKFSAALEVHKTRCRRWEEHHNGNCCVVERVRDKYVMPRVRGFLAALSTHTGKRGI